MKILAIGSRNEAENYPYGRLRTSAFFSVEFKPKKGFRSVFQTINPKTGKLNAPKYSTYSNFMCNVQQEDGHFKTLGFSVYGNKSYNAIAKFINENAEALQMTDEMMAFIKTLIRNSIIISIAWLRQGNGDTEAQKALYEQALESLKNAKGFEGFYIDEEKIEEAKLLTV